MMNSTVERRAKVFRNSQGEQFDAAVVTEGMKLQRQVNTVTAIEYMKNRGISGAIIQRVLDGFDGEPAWPACHTRHASDAIGAGA